MRIGDIIEFRKDLYFEGAVQADWFYSPEKAAKVSENFVFHGKNYYGGEANAKGKAIDTISLTKTFSKKLNDETANPLSLAIADYGTGKSHLAVTLGQLLSGSFYMPETFSKIIQNIKRIDEEAAKEIQDYCSDRNFVIVINGMRDFNLHYEILRAAQRSLLLYGLEDDKLKSLNRALETANLFFERNCTSQIELFERSAAAHNWNETGNQLISKIRDRLVNDDIAFEIINDVYKMVTGKEISWDEGISARSVLEMLLSEYCGLNGQFDHVIILFDEFGRYLEYASGSDASKSGDSALQQIFEVAQDADGVLQVINFIQSDIKTYLVRVDQTRNISRYIGRYDQSDKYHISSNLETVFANLIYRSDREAFNNTIVKWQTENEEKWASIYKQMGKWLSLNGVWADYTLFRKVIVEGIYPMHPLATFMLTQLSDYLQNRSSMNLISQYIEDISDKSIDDQIPLVLPEELMRGDLYQEMLSAEMNGKQLSQHCIRYDNILRKQGDKLSNRSLMLLRANLIVRILRFKTRDYDDAKQALSLCSGLSSHDLDEELNILENEYAVLGFDEHAGCFDFMEDSRGAHEYKIKKKRIAATWKSDFRMLFKTAKILEIGEISEPQETSFGMNHKILTNEWKFTQEILMAEDITEDIISGYIKYWKVSRSAALPKGRIVWAYISKDTDYMVIERLQKFAKILEGMPVVLLLLNDNEGRLASALQNYDLLDQMDDNIRQTYERAYADDFNQAEGVLQNEFETLRKKRECVFSDGIKPLKKRLQVALTEIFENIYPQAISFNFDGLLTTSNNFTGKGSTYFCQIVKMLLSNNVNYDSIHDFTSDVRNRISAVLMETSATSWKCISRDYSIMPPVEAKARSVYEATVEKLNTDKTYDCASFFDCFCYPPYGLSEETAVMMLSVILANHNYCVRIAYNNGQSNIIRWKDEIIIKDKKINLDFIKASKLVLIDTNVLEARFQQLFNRIDSSSDIEDIIEIYREIEKLDADNGIPESLESNSRIAKIKYETALRSKKEWDESIGKINDEIYGAAGEGDVYRGLKALEYIDEIPFYSIFDEKNFVISDDYKEHVKKLSAEAKAIVSNYFEVWLDQTIHCRSVQAMTQFEKHVRRCSDKLLKFGFNDFAQKITAKGERELSKKDEIRSREELLSDCKKYIELLKNTSLNNYTDILDMLSKAKGLLERLDKFEQSLGKDAKKYHSYLDQVVAKLKEAQQKIMQCIEKVWDDLDNAATQSDIETVLAGIAKVMNYRVPAKDLQDLEELKNALDVFVADIDLLKEAEKDRNKLNQVINTLKEKYFDTEMDFDVQTVLEDCIRTSLNSINKKDSNWRQQYLTLGDRSRNTLHAWREATRVLPGYLNQETIDLIQKLKVEADELLSEAMIDDVVFYFNKLNDDEKKKCLDMLMQKNR